MKLAAVILSAALVCAGIGAVAYRATAHRAAPFASASQPFAKFLPAGALLYLEAKDFSTLLSDWNSSPQKKRWLQSDSYEVFSRSRLFLRLQGASDQFAAAAGLPPNMDFISQVSGEHSVIALYDIGNLEFLYITYLPSAKAMESTLWRTRAKFEPRSAGGVNFYLRRDPESKREVAFAISGDYLVLATREDLMAGALQLMSGKPDRSLESEPWWARSTAEAGPAGDLRMVLDLEKLVPNGYFRTYWVQQNITDLSQYSAAVSDLFRSKRQYREERVLIRKKEADEVAAADGLAVAGDLVRLVPDDAGGYAAAANPTADSCFALLESKLLAPNVGAVPASQMAPQVTLTSGEQGGASDLETRIDQVRVESPAQQSKSELQELLEQTPLLASLQVQSTERDQSGVFARTHSVVILSGASDWNEAGVESALANFVRPRLTAGQLGVDWQLKSGYQVLDGLWPLAVSVRGKDLLVSDQPTLMESVLANFGRKSDRKPAQLFAGFNHERERKNFTRFAGLVDRPNMGMSNGQSSQREPQFFSGNMGSLSATLAAVSAERIEVRGDAGKVRQTVTYEWSQ